jgi:hypothetical protein
MKEVWKWLSGKKSVIGLTAAIVLAWTEQQGYIPSHVYQMLLSILTVWGVLAVGHKAYKATA